MRPDNASPVPALQFRDLIPNRVVTMPTLNPGRILRVRVEADLTTSGAADVALILRVYEGDQTLSRVTGAPNNLSADQAFPSLRVPVLEGRLIAGAGINITNRSAAPDGNVRLTCLNWSCAPDVVFRRPDRKAHSGANLVCRRQSLQQHVFLGVPYVAERRARAPSTPRAGERASGSRVSSPSISVAAASPHAFKAFADTTRHSSGAPVALFFFRSGKEPSAS